MADASSAGRASAGAGPAGRGLRQVVTSFPVRAGVAVGTVTAGLFLLVHALLIEPIWLKGGLRAAGVAVVVGGTVGWGYGRLREGMPGSGLTRGAWFGLLLALTFLPSMLAAGLRVGGTSLGTALLLLAPLLPLVLAAQWLGASSKGAAFTRRGLRRGGLVVGLGILLNGYPAGFLLFLPEIVQDGTPNPYVMPLVLLALEVLAGVALEALIARRVSANG